MMRIAYPLFYAHSHYENKCWRWWLVSRHSSLKLISLEVSWRFSMWMAEISLGDEETQLGFTLAAFGLFLHAGFNYLPIPKFLTHYVRGSQYSEKPRLIEYPRCLDFGINAVVDRGLLEDGLFVQLKFFSKSDMSGHHEYCSGPKISFNPFDSIFGEVVYNSEIIQEFDTQIELPEASYPMHFEIRRDSWSRPRYWGEKIVYRCDAEVPEGGAPIPNGACKFCDSNDIYRICVPISEDDFLPLNLVDFAKQKIIDHINEDRNIYQYDILPFN